MVSFFQLLWGFKGTLQRSHFFILTLPSLIINLFLNIYSYNFSHSTILFVLLYFVIWLNILACTARRLRHIGYNERWSFLLFVPLLDTLLILWCWFKKGKSLTDYSQK